jgi:hypothetical protein
MESRARTREHGPLRQPARTARSRIKDSERFERIGGFAGRRNIETTVRRSTATMTTTTE